MTTIIAGKQSLPMEIAALSWDRDVQTVVRRKQRSSAEHMDRLLKIGGLDVELALSGETPSSELLTQFIGVGLVRSEYLYRGLGLYPTNPAASDFVRQYTQKICSISPGDVVYRTMEVTAAEANVLEGVEEKMFEAADDLMGLRGVRRHMRHPASLIAELAALSNVYQDHPNLVVIAPFVTGVDEYVWFSEMVREHVGDKISIGMMVEIPSTVLAIDSFVDAGLERVVVGTNDLSSLLSAQRRMVGARTSLVPGMREALSTVRKSLDSVRGRMTVAGYLDRELASVAGDEGADACVIHYTDLKRFFSIPDRLLSETDHLAAVKRKTRSAIASAS